MSDEPLMKVIVHVSWPDAKTIIRWWWSGYDISMIM